MVRRAYAIAFAVLFVCAGFAGLASGLSPQVAPATAASVDAAPELGAGSDRFARTTFEIRAYDNGSIRWTTRYSKPLNESEVADFESFATEFNTTETDLYSGFTELGEGLARAGTRQTNRTMTARGFERRAYVDRSALALGTQGKVEMSFVLTNLSRVRGDRVIMGDAFEGGLYLQPGQKLVVEAGPGLAFAQAEPTPDSISDPGSLRDSDTVTWEGELEFNDERPYLVLAPPSTLTPTTTTTTAVTTTDGVTSTTAGGPPADPTTVGTTPTTVGTTPAGAGGSGGGMLVVGVIVLLLGVGTVAVWRVTGSGEDGGAVPGDDGAGPESPAATASAESPGADADTGADAAGAAGEPAAEESLLTDSDRVQQLLDDHGGRMRQSEIVEETDWSKSKVSMLLSDMEDDDEITKLRVGRENLISLPGHEPEAAGSPFEDEE